MTNGEKYKTAKERNAAFRSFCNLYQYCDDCPLDGHDTDDCNGFKWLDLEAEEEKPMNCPCGGKMVFADTKNSPYQRLVCEKCGMRTVGFKTKAEAIAAYNHICKAVAAYKESEVK